MQNPTYDARILRLLDTSEAVIDVLEKENLLPLKHEDLGLFKGQHMEGIRQMLSTVVMDKEGFPLSILTDVGPEIFKVEDGKLISTIIHGLTFVKTYDLETGKQLKGHICTYDADGNLTEEIGTDSYTLSDDKRYYTRAVNMSATYNSDGVFTPDYTMVTETKKEVVGSGYCLTSTIQRINSDGKALNVVPFKTEFFTKDHRSISATMHSAEDKGLDVTSAFSYGENGDLVRISASSVKGDAIDDVVLKNTANEDGKLLKSTMMVDVPVETEDMDGESVTATQKEEVALFDFTDYYASHVTE